jgi:hypothetical protein
MNSYSFVTGETAKYADPSPEVADFLARVRTAANDPNVSVLALQDLIYGMENPILDKKMLPGRAMVTMAVFKNPIHHILLDQIDRKRIQLGKLDMAAMRAAHTLTVPQAARRLEITPAAVRAAINTYRLSAIYENGQYWVHPDSVASYRVSTRGPKGKRRKVRR